MSYPDIKWNTYIKPSIIFDIGAYDCSDSIMFKMAYPNAVIHAFEASNNNFQRCKTNIQGTSIHIHQYALSDKDGEIDFFESYGINDASGSILEYNNNRTGLYMHPSYKVPSITIDTFCELYQIYNIDIAHLDVQGAEYFVLSGANKVLPKLVFAETCEYQFYKGSKSQKELDDLMFSKGYTIAERLIYDTLYVLK